MKNSNSIMVGVSSPVMKSASLSRLHALSPSQATARKLVRKYSLTNNRLLVGQRRELTALRTSLPNVKAASDLDVVLAAIAYIEQLQHKVVYLSQLPPSSQLSSTTSSSSSSNAIHAEGERRLREKMEMVVDEEARRGNKRREERIDNRKNNTETNNN